MAEFIQGAMRKAEVLEGVPAEHVKRSRMIAKHTAEYYDSDGNRRVRYVQTTIFEQLFNGVIILRNGGYVTATTKKRINDQLPAGWSVWQTGGHWYVSNGFSWGNADEVERFLFVDDMRLEPLGDDKYTVVYPNGFDPLSEEKRVKLLKKLIGSYVTEVKMLARDNALPYPTLGDCFICLAESQTKVEPGVNSRANDHLMSHMEEKYVHGTFIANALIWAGYRKEQLPYIWNVSGIAARATRRYLKYRFGLA